MTQVEDGPAWGRVFVNSLNSGTLSDRLIRIGKCRSGSAEVTLGRPPLERKRGCETTIERGGPSLIGLELSARGFTVSLLFSSGPLAERILAWTNRPHQRTAS